ncbi:hypothetical protein F2Q69_00004271 [Brassica cretica]|uniref:DUF4283 domain-containing protein n=1 Tax=Brassica cretica TaxID=69181 RepID=A0A8S9PF74_BRACR|nr:hypothetical protein F2Q69_00004271 [Brassica cretica]
MTANSRSDDEGENSENPKDDGDGKSAEDLSQAVLETMIAEGDKSVDRNCAGEHTGESGGPKGNAEAVSPHVGSVLQVGQSESKGNAEAVSPRRSGSQENPSVGSVGSGSEFLFGVLFRIEDAQVRSRILRRKYWHIAEVPLVLNEWSPESARAPPDLSAMPLWVDFVNLPENEHLAPKVDKVVQEVACSGKAVVSKLLDELESLKSAQQAHVIEESGVRRDSAVESGNVIDARAGENWYLVSGQNQKRSSPTKQKNVEVAKGISRSPNGFLALQDIREEGEIEDDAEEDYVQGIEEDPSKLAEGGNSRDVLLLRGSISSQRGKAKGSRRPIVNSRDLRASVVTNQSRKSSLRKK